ncbi:recombinase family protein [Streptomyces daliensis]|uniref:Recombinase family protein n=1 Tax=Streptomyces daliensis TaxID=299421 RepID=A0A8T4IZU7_9ACTN|nr:recombinase family protein [Streptomyces daliensis]
MGIVTDPAKLCDLFLRRSTLQDDKTTLRAHERDLRERVVRENLTVRKVWKEELSAFKSGVVREEFDKAILAVVNGEVKHLFVWKLDRLSRKGMGQVGQVLDQFDAKGARLVAHMDGLDSSIPQHRGLFAWLAEQARSESFNTSVRVRSTKEERKLAGEWPGGQPPFGLRENKKTRHTEHHPKEYRLSREIADALLEGKTAMEIASALNEKGRKTRRGYQWRSSTITILAHSPAWAGLMPKHERYTDKAGRERWRALDEPLTGPDGSPVRAGKGVVTPGERARILANLRSRISFGPTTGQRRGKPVARSLMAGRFKCGRCAGPMTKGGKQYRCYRRVHLGRSACQGMAVLVLDIERVMERAFVKQVSSFTPEHALYKELASRWLSYKDPESDTRLMELSASLDEAQARLKSLDDAYYVLGRFKGAEGEHRYEGMRSAISAQIETLSAEREKVSANSAFLRFSDLEEMESAWRDAELEEKRMLLGVVMHSVTLLPPPNTGPRSLWELMHRCCFHWVGEKPQAHELDPSRAMGVSWPDEYMPHWARAA